MKVTETPEYIDFSVPASRAIHAQCMEEAPDAVFWVDIDLAIKKD